MSSHSEELRILSVHGKGEGPLALHGHDALFTASEPEALSSLSTEHSVVKSLERGERLVRREELTGQQTPDTISIKEEEDIDGGMPAVEDCDDFGDRSTQRDAPSDSLHVDAPGSSHMSSHSKELRILSVHGKGEGPLALHGHDALFTASKQEALSSLSTEHIVAKSLERGKRLVHCEELTGQQTPDTISIKDEKDIDGGMPAVEDCDDFGDRSTQRDAPSDSLHVDAPGSSHMSSHSKELRILSVHGKGEGPLALHGHDALFTASKQEALSSLSTEHIVAKSLERGKRLVHCEELTGQQTPDTISIKDEKDIDGGMPAVEDCDDFGDRSTQRDAPSDSLHVDAPGSSHMSSHSKELRILSVHGKGEGPLALHGHDALFTASKQEALSSLSTEHIVAKSLERGKRLVHCEELTGQQTPDTISIKDEKDIDGGMPAVEDCDDFGDRSTQRDAPSDSLHVDAPGSSHMSSHSKELRILSVHGKGEGPLALHGHDALFTASKQEALSSLSTEHIVAKSLERGKRLVHCEELTGQQTPDTISIKDEKDIDGGMPAVEDCDDFGDCSTQYSSTLDSLHVEAPGSSHLSSHNGELRILRVYGKGEGPLAVDGHDNPFTVFKPEVLSSLSAEHSMGKSLERGEQLVHREELTGHQGDGKDRPGVLSCEDFPNNTNMIQHMRTHTGEKPYGCDQCKKRFKLKGSLKSHMRTHSGEKLYSCDQCLKCFTKNSHLKSHMRTHSGERPYRCDQCVKCFRSKGNLMSHIRTHSGEKPYRCEQCDMCFSKSSHLTNHMRTHSGEKPYTCDQCLKCFPYKGNLKSHMRTHSGEKPYMCNQCQKRFSESSSLRVHIKTHSGEKPYRCDQCVKCFSKSSLLKSHMRTHSGENPYRCDQCLKCFQSKGNLKSHMRTHSGEKPFRCNQCEKRFSESYTLKIHMRTHSGEKPYRCDQCEKCFSQSFDLKMHLRNHTGEKPYGCDQCMKRFQLKGSLKSHMRTHSGEKPYRCDQCVKRYSQSSYLRIHMRTHSGEKPYKCDQCARRFSQSSDLKVHMLTHSEEKPYRCYQCEKCFSLNATLKRHMMIHSGEKPYRCDQCVKCFSQSSHLKKHMRTHSGEKPYRCDQCEKCFSLSFSLKIHMRTHSGEKPYRCDQCVKRFSRSSVLKSHMTTHSKEKPYRCDQCLKHFQKKGNLKSHMRTHSGEKPYRCNHCEKCFSQSSSLTIHMRTHSGEKPYRCDQCVKRFRQSSDLKVHMRTHSGEKPYRCDQCVKCFQRKGNLKSHMMTHSGEKPFRCNQCKKCFGQRSHLNVHLRTHSLKS